ncbi:hypothetical protein BG005_006653 [Podila minutissima]|nr:hypothetical protein BG005_006653 [Podila minutissima]
MENSNLQLITLLDFPAPSLRVSYLSEPNNPEFSGYQLEYTMNVDGLAPTWVEVLKQLALFSGQVYKSNTASATFPTLSATSPNGFPAQAPEHGFNITISTIGLFNRTKNLAGLFNVQETTVNGLTQVRMPTIFGPNLLKAGTLSQITVDTDHDEFNGLESVLEMKPWLSTVKLEIHEFNLLHFAVACLHHSRDGDPGGEDDSPARTVQICTQ